MTTEGIGQIGCDSLEIVYYLLGLVYFTQIRIRITQLCITIIEFAI